MGRSLELLVPITTPFGDDGCVDSGALASNIEHLLECGVDGIVVAGSTGEAALLDEKETADALQAAREVIPPTRRLVAGTGAESTRATIAATAMAVDAGADAVMVRPPCYYGGALDETAVIAHYESVADASELPMLLYNIPKYTPVTLTPKLVESLAQHAQVTGLKDSGGDMDRFADFRAAGPQLTLYVGSLGHVPKAVSLGADGGILAAACFVPREVRRLLDLAGEGSDEALALADRLRGVARAIVGQAGIPGIKYAMDRLGFCGGPSRSPLRSLDEEEQRRVDEALTAVEAGALTVE